MNRLKLVTASWLAAAFLPVALLAQVSESQTANKCQENPATVSQLPLAQNCVVLKYPWEWNKLRGAWRAMSGAQVVAERGCPGGYGGICASMLPEEKDGPCFAGTIDLTMFLGLVKPGEYVVGWMANEGGAALGPIMVTIQEPQGVDKEVYEKFLLPGWASPLAQADWGGWLAGGYTRGKPSAASQILEKYPTSTYAGYVLRQQVPSLAQWALACLNNPDETLQTWGNRGGGAENTRSHIAEAQGDMRVYAKNAEAFLKAHPDFVYAPLIRRMYAMCLGLTGHIPEAMAEIQTLSATSGKEAEEAKAYLDSTKKKTTAKP